MNAAIARARRKYGIGKRAKRKELELDYWVQFAHIPDDRETAWLGPFGNVRISYSDLQASTASNRDVMLAIHTNHTATAVKSYPEWALQSDDQFYTDVFIVATAKGEGPPQ